jgi:hypothetical protein
VKFDKVAAEYFRHAIPASAARSRSRAQKGPSDRLPEINHHESPSFDWRTTGAAIMANQEILKARIGEAADALVRDEAERKRSNATLDRTLARLEERFHERATELEHLAARIAPLDRANRDAASLIERLVGFTERCAAENADSTVAAARRMATEAWPDRVPPETLRYEDVTEAELAVEDGRGQVAAPEVSVADAQGDDDILALLRRVREIKEDSPKSDL